MEAQEWTLTVDRAPRMLPIPPTDERHQVFAHQRQGHEREHNNKRIRNRVAEKTKRSAPRQIGYLRSNADMKAGIFLDNLRYCLRMGYLLSPPGLLRQVKVFEGPKVTYQRLAAKLREDLAKKRREALLHLPYGKGTGPWGGHPLPPSHRPKPDKPPDRASP